MTDFSDSLLEELGLELLIFGLLALLELMGHRECASHLDLI